MWHQREKLPLTNWAWTKRPLGIHILFSKVWPTVFLKPNCLNFHRPTPPRPNQSRIKCTSEINWLEPSQVKLENWGLVWLVRAYQPQPAATGRVISIRWRVWWSEGDVSDEIHSWLWGHLQHALWWARPFWRTVCKRSGVAPCHMVVVSQTQPMNQCHILCFIAICRSIFLPILNLQRPHNISSYIWLLFHYNVVPLVRDISEVHCFRQIWSTDTKSLICICYRWDHQ